MSLQGQGLLYHQGIAVTAHVPAGGGAQGLPVAGGGLYFHQLQRQHAADGADGAPRIAPRWLLLACAAIEGGIAPIGRNPL